MEEIKTSFNDKNGVGAVTLRANSLGKGKKFVAYFDRNVMSIEHLLANIKKKNPSADEIAINTSISYLKREILDTLKEGKAVNLLDLGVLYISASGSVANDSATEISALELAAKFTPSQIVKDAVSQVKIGKVTIANFDANITKIIDFFSGKESDELHIGKNVIIEGKKLKLGESNSGVYLAPISESGEMNTDSATWIDCSRLVRESTKSKINFFIPDDTAEGRYRIVVKTSYTGSKDERKEPLYAYSEIISAIK